MDAAMTEEQRRFATENHNLIYYYMHKNHLDVDEWYGVLATEFCKGVMTWMESKGAFSTYACAVLRNGHLQELKRQKRRPYISNVFSDRVGCGADGDELLLEDVLPDSNNIEDFYITKAAIDGEIAKSSDLHKQILDLYYYGYTPAEIVKELNVGQSTVSRTLTKFKANASKSLNF